VVDTHAHLTLCEPPAAELVAAARSAGVRRILTVGIDHGSNHDALAASEEFDEVFASVGRHPNSAAGFDDVAASEISALADEPSVVAIGETGLDYYRDGAPRAEQRAAFAAQVEIAGDAGLPVVIHVRDEEGSTEAVDEAFATLDQRARGPVILHCFSAPQRVGDAAERGWYCSFAGNVTYPRAEELRVAATAVPEELLLVETDSPYLAPQPVRGRPNQPANVLATAEAIADVRGVSAERLEGTVEGNAERLFGWSA
jgi:TatD DNase family protein